MTNSLLIRDNSNDIINNLMSGSTTEEISKLDNLDVGWERVEKENKFDKVEQKIKSSWKEATQKVENLKKKVITNKEVQKMTQKYEKLIQKQENPSFLIALDEIKFTFGVISMFFTFGVIFYPNVNILAYWVTFINMILIVLRFIEYKSKDWHYFFFDYCYFVNLGVWIFVLLFPKNPMVFFMSGMNALGPMLNYFVIFKPKLIYQSREAVTSFTMHYTPSLLYWILIYHNQEKNGRFITREEISEYLHNGGIWSQLWVFMLGFGFYSVWMLFYYVMIFHVKKHRIEEKKYQTLYSYTVDDFKRFNKLILKFGPDYAPLMYTVLHLTQGLVGNIFSLIFINSRVIIALALFCYLVIPIYNSSVYYFEYFSKDYQNKVNRRATDYKEKRTLKARSHSNDPTGHRKSSNEVTTSADESSQTSGS